MFEQSANAYSPILVTEFEITIDSRLLHCLNASNPILVTGTPLISDGITISPVAFVSHLTISA